MQDWQSAIEFPEGFDVEQGEKLRQRKRSPGQTEEEKWKEVYHILFLDEDEADIPEPCKF
jgi:hypothetical protein